MRFVKVIGKPLFLWMSLKALGYEVVMNSAIIEALSARHMPPEADD